MSPYENRYRERSFDYGEFNYEWVLFGRRHLNECRYRIVDYHVFNVLTQ